MNLNFNPLFFSAILGDDASVSFLLVLEYEYATPVISTEGENNNNHRFFMSSSPNKDPRTVNTRLLVPTNFLEVPEGLGFDSMNQYLCMAHQFMFLVDQATDSLGWQYNNDNNSSSNWQSNPDNAQIRRRLWFCTLVPRSDLNRTKHLLSDNIRLSQLALSNSLLLEGEMLRYERGTLTKIAWQKRLVRLYPNRLEFFSADGDSKKGEVSLVDCEVKLLMEQQWERDSVLSIRNPLGSVGILLDCLSRRNRLIWAQMLRYQLALHSTRLDFPPLDFSPPCIFLTNPGRVVLLCGDCHVRVVSSNNNNNNVERESGASPKSSYTTSTNSSGTGAFLGSLLHVQLCPEKLLFWDGSVLAGRLSVEKMSVFGDGSTVNCSNKAFVVSLLLESVDEQQVQAAESQRIKLKTSPKEEVACLSLADRVLQFRDEPISVSVSEPHEPVSELIWSANRSFPTVLVSEEEEDFMGIDRKPPSIMLQQPPPSLPSVPVVPSPTVSVSSLPPLPLPAPVPTVSQPPPSRSKSSESRRSLINPKSILTVLKGLTHRFVLVLESESRCQSGIDVPMGRFSVGGARACKDPRITPVDQLRQISNRNPEIQLPAGWLMLHQYIYIVQQNTDAEGWQYRSVWSSEGVLSSRNEQWSDECSEERLVRRRLWMTTVVRKEDLLKAKKLLGENLQQGVRQSAEVMQGNLWHFSEQSWQKCKVTLSASRLEVFVGNDKKAEALLKDCEVRLFQSPCNGKDFSFSLVSLYPTVKTLLLLSTDCRDTRLRWVKALQYNLATNSFDVNFPPFDYGPPIGDVPDNRVLLCGDLCKRGNIDKQRWIRMHFQLRPMELLFSLQDKVKGKILLDGAVIKDLKDEEDSKDFSVRSASGLTLMCRAASTDMKSHWMRSIRRQVQSIESNRQKNLLDDGNNNNNNSLFSEERRCQFQEEDWEVLGDDWREDLDFLRQVADKAKKAINVEIWNYYDDEDLDEASDVSSWQNNQHSRSLSQPTSKLPFKHHTSNSTGGDTSLSDSL